MLITLQSFNGIAPATNPRYLPDGGAQFAYDVEAFGTSLRPMFTAPDSAYASPLTSPATLYWYGRSLASIPDQWLAWSADVDVARSQIAADVYEWTFYTGDGAPKAIYKDTVLSPLKMGIERATTAPVCAAVGAVPGGDVLPETRVYVVTLVRRAGGLDAESAPSLASAATSIYPTTQTMNVTLPALPVGSEATHIRVYRAVAGEYLYVTEVAASAAGTTINDAVGVDGLGEPLPTVGWIHPPSTLRGLVNLPNGMMAGFSGQDVYFSVPYRPYAWPTDYVQVVDYPVVGLGVIDTTLVVLTTGTPYLIQGAEPEALAMVKTELEQACVSKRSIVSMAGSVLYAAPDGLVRVSAGSSEVVTASRFRREQWQEMFNPSTIHAYAHNGKYVAFYNSGSVSGALIYDLASGQIVLSSVYAQAAFADLYSDTLYIKQSDALTLRKWDDGLTGEYESAVWSSKLFTMPKPVSFSCAQVEAEAYPVTMTVEGDGESYTVEVQNRRPVRLPPHVARDWEITLHFSGEVFNVALAQSMEELAGA